MAVDGRSATPSAAIDISQRALHRTRRNQPRNADTRILKQSIQPLFDFVEIWDCSEKKFVDEERQVALSEIYEAPRSMACHLVEKTVPIGNMEYASVFSDASRTNKRRISLRDA